MSIRWNAKRKAAVLASVDAGEMTESEAMRLHEISPEELAEWRSRFAMGGVDALKVRSIQVMRIPR